MQSLAGSQLLDMAAVPLVLGEHRPCPRRQEGKELLLPMAVLEMPAGVRTGLTAPDGSRRGAWRRFNCAFAIAVVVSVCSKSCCELRDTVLGCQVGWSGERELIPSQPCDCRGCAQLPCLGALLQYLHKH